MKIIIGFIFVGLLAGLVPFGLIALARSQTSTQPPVHPIQDMFRQQKFRPQRVNPMFADGRAMRPELPGVTASTDLALPNEVVNDPDDPHMIDHRNAPIELDDELKYQRVVEGTEPQADGKPAYVTRIPLNVSMDLLERGRERFTIYCAVCHGQGGYGDGPVARPRGRDPGRQRRCGGLGRPQELPYRRHAAAAGGQDLQHDYQRRPQHAGILPSRFRLSTAGPSWPT